eukprot:11163348-Lingulodinium_polyedra.AAC.1
MHRRGRFGLAEGIRPHPTVHGGAGHGQNWRPAVGGRPCLIRVQGGGAPARRWGPGRPVAANLWHP